MRKTILTTAVAFAFISASASAQTFTVVNQAHVRPGALAKVERAIAAQSHQLAAAWGTPLASFGPGGWPLYLEPNLNGWSLHYAPFDTGLGSFAGDTACSHRPDVTMPCALVSVGQDWTIKVSHEVMETLADPSGQGEEVCDPVEDWAYRLDGVWVSDFVFPASAIGRRDQMGVLNGYRRSARGQKPPR